METPKGRWTGLVLAVALGQALCCSIAHGAQSDPAQDDTPRGAGTELRRLHAVLVIDTNSNLKESVSVDGDRMKLLLQETVPPNRLNLKTLTGNDVNERTILATIQSLPVSGSDSLLFFYAGHGAQDQEKGHWLAFEGGKSGQLLRSKLRQTMRDKHAGLTLILTDCCSNTVPLPKTKKNRPARPTPNVVAPVVRNLLFQHRGIVDVTASTESSYGDDDNGGIFTRTLAELMQGDPKLLDKNKDGFVSWQEFYPLLEDGTDQTFKRWAKDMRARGEQIGQTSQRPRKFDLADPLGEVGKDVALAVIGLRNAGTMPLAYQFRWAGDTKWSKSSLDAGKTAVLSFRLGDAKDNLPNLEVLFDGDKESLQLKPKLWVGKGSPSYAVSRKYKIETDESKTRGAGPPRSDDGH